jgi:hypothetical protein
MMPIRTQQARRKIYTRDTRERYTRDNIKLKLHSLNRNEEYTTYDTDQQLVEQEYRDRAKIKSGTS